MELFTVIYRTAFFYIFVLVAYRIMGKREVGQLGIIDLIVSIMVAELVAMSIENKSEPMILTMIPIVVLVILEMLLAFLSMKSKKIRNIIDGKPSLLISRGHINYHEMVKQRYSLDDLLINLRQNEIRNIDEVEYAVLEPNGKLSVFKYKPFRIKGSYPMPIIIDGNLQEKSLKSIKMSKNSLNKELQNKNLDINNIFYAFHKNNKIYIIKKNNS